MTTPPPQPTTPQPPGPDRTAPHPTTQTPLTQAPPLSFPRHSARTQRFTLGAPRAFSLSPDGHRLVFLRSRSGTDRITCLWVLDRGGADQPGGAERLVADPRALVSDQAEQLSPAEQARRERAREGAGGVVGYAVDRDHALAAFALSGRLWVADLALGTAREVTARTPVIDPRPDPTGRRVAYVTAGALRVADVDGTADRALAEPDGDDVSWGLAEFIAAEEMQRSRGFWWAPGGERLLVARVDASPVQRWYIADPANPDAQPTEVAYPAAGTPNAAVTLAMVDLDGHRTDVAWDHDRFPYLVSVHWSAYGDPLLLVQSRGQRTTAVLGIDPTTGKTRLLREDSDPQWVEIVPGAPAWLPDGRLLTVADDRDVDARRLLVDGRPVTQPEVQIRAILDVAEDGVLLAATDEPTQAHLWRWHGGELRRLTHAPGVHSGRAAGGTTLISTSALGHGGAKVTLERDGRTVAAVASYADRPAVLPRVDLRRAGARELRTAVLVPTGWEPERGSLPVLMDPYAGPHAQRVVAARNAYLSSQWLADQGFAVVVVDGRGTPGGGPGWERAVWRDLAGPVLQDQVDALHALAAEAPWLDLSRVGIRGWSFGGYLAALAVLRRPDVFHAAVAGAPVIDWALYDTHYTERYLGTPEHDPEAYARSSLIADADLLTRPLMLIHGLADDNVVAAHTLRMSSALLAAGRAHTVLPLSGVTHMTPQEVVAENLLVLQVRFLKDALGVP